MQNSYGKLEHSNIKCSPIFQKLDSEKNNQETSSELMNNFPYNSMMLNKVGTIRSNFEDQAKFKDAMTPYYNRIDENGINNVHNFSEGINQTQESPNGDPNLERKERMGGEGQINSNSGNLSNEDSVQNKKIMELNFNMGFNKLTNPGTIPSRAHNSAFLVNYNNNALINLKNNFQYHNSDSNKNEIIKDNENISEEQGRNKKESLFYSPPQSGIPTVFSSIMGSTSGSFLKPSSSLFTGKSCMANMNTPLKKEEYSHNFLDSGISGMHPKIKIKEVIKQSDYNRQIKNGKNILNLKQQNDSILQTKPINILAKYNNIYSSEEDDDEENLDEESEEQSEELEDPQSNEMSSYNQSGDQSDESIIILRQNVSQIPKKNTQYDFLKQKKRREIRTEFTNQELLNENEPQSPEIKIKSIKNILESSSNNKTNNTNIEKLAKKRGAYKKRNKNNENSQEEDVVQIPHDNLQTNKFTKKIIEDTIITFSNNSKNEWNHNNLNFDNTLNRRNKSQILPNINFNQIYTQRENEENNPNKRKVRRFKKTEKSFSEISIEEKNNPVALKDIEYLLRDINEDDNLNMSCSFYNPSLKSDFLQYVSKGRSNENKLSFGSNPLTSYRDLAEWYFKEKNKLESSGRLGIDIYKSTEMCGKILQDMNKVSFIISSLPVLKKPEVDKKSTYQNKKKKKLTQMEMEKKFKCEVCCREGKEQYFETGQGLGGHMSRVHKGESEKFNKKKEIRSKREEFRKILVEAKKIILSESGFDYEFLNKNREGKLQIKHFIKDRRDKYRKLVRELRKSSNLNRGY